MKLKIKESKLENGLSLLEVPREVPSVMVMAMVRAGSRDEREGQYGGAHFLEHFVFKGTKKYPQVNEIAREVDSLGGQQNAFTSSDYTGFWVRLAEEYWRKGVEVVGQMVSEPLLPADQLEKEKGTIIEEIRMYEDDPMSKAWMEMEKSLFAGCDLERHTLGTEKSIRKMRVEDLQGFRDNWYWGENMAVVAVGSLPESGQLKEAIEAEFGSLVKNKKTERLGYGEDLDQDQARVKVVKRDTQQAHLVLGMEGLARADEDRYSLWVLNQILGGNMSSRLWNEVREKRGLAYYIKSGFEGKTDVGQVYVRAGVRVDKAKEAVEIIKEELAKVAGEKVSGEEVKRGREGVKGGLKLALESSEKVAMRIGNDWSLVGEVRDVEEEIVKIDEVSRADVMRVAEELFVPGKMNLSVVGPFEEGEFEGVV